MLIIGAAIFVANKLGGGRIASRSGATRTGVVMASITIKGLTKSFSAGDDAPAAVADLDLDIKDNQFVTLLGPERLRQDHDACGMIAGYLVPDAGTIHVDGRLISVARQRRAAGPARHGHGVPELRGVAAQDRVRERRVRPEGAQDAVGRGEEARSTRRWRWSTSPGSKQRYPERAVRRPAAARRARAQPRGRAGNPAARRAAVQSRRQAARAACASS